MERSSVAQSDVERARLQAVVARLTDPDMARAMSEEWTVEVGLMHLAFWDGLSLSKFAEWERTGRVDILPLQDMVEGINRAQLAWWRTIAPAQIRYAVVAATEAVDRKVETLPAPIIDAILAVRPRSLTRAIHRRQHLDQIERALAGRSSQPPDHRPPTPGDASWTGVWNLLQSNDRCGRGAGVPTLTAPHHHATSLHDDGPHVGTPLSF
jgi:hypothetical protein